MPRTPLLLWARNKALTFNCHDLVKHVKERQELRERWNMGLWREREKERERELLEVSSLVSTKSKLVHAYYGGHIYFIAPWSFLAPL